MNGRIALLCPTRGRPESLGVMRESVGRTSNNADVLVYVDSDQKDIYRDADGVTQV